MVPASKRFTLHRSSNVLTISLKRFANYNGGKIAKVSVTLSSLTLPTHPTPPIVHSSGKIRQ